jgi:hypothetical protein
MAVLIITHRHKFPESVRQFECLKGICIGRCIDKKNTIEGVSAHAHSIKRDRFAGWICFHEKWQLGTNTLYHEVAHLLVNTVDSVPSHGKQWYEKYIEIGGILHDRERRHIIRYAPWLKKYMPVE